MAYEFKLEALLRFRIHEEERLQKDFSEAQRNLSVARQNVFDHIALKLKTEEDFALNHKETTGPQVLIYRTYLDQLGKQIDELKKNETLCFNRWNETRNKLLEAMKNRKAINKLKEKDLAAYEEKIKNNEKRFIDEIAVNRFNLNQR